MCANELKFLRFLYIIKKIIKINEKFFYNFESKKNLFTYIVIETIMRIVFFNI